jgi:4-amino-4-deoxy-L-arabinose transferase-like glycosyltransferase
MPSLPSGKEGFYYLLASLYWVFGAHTAAGLAVNATLGAALAPLLSDTTRRLFGPAAAEYAVKLVVLLPGLFLWTSQLLKEAPILLLIAVTANLASRLVERLSFFALVGLGTALAFLFTFRAWVALVLAGGLTAGITFGKDRVVSGLSTGLSALAFVALVVSLGVGYSGYQAAIAADLEEAHSVRRDLALSAASGYDAEADISTSTGAITYLPKGLFNFALGPFPWQIRQARQLIVLPEVVAWWALLPSLVRGVRKGWSSRGRRCLIVILPAAGVACLLALAIGNFGTVVRERMQLVVVLIPFLALGLAQRAVQRSEEVQQDALIAAA